MKKKIFSFVVLVITLIALVAFSVPTIKDKTVLGMEYNGGFDILYEVESENDELDNKELVKTASEAIEKRLDIANVINPTVSKEGNKYIRVTVSSSNQILSDNIRNIIESDTEITFRDTENTLLATGEELLSDVGAELGSDDYGNVTILLNIKDTEKLGEITQQIVDSSASEKKLVVWMGYEEGDSYADISTNATVAKKIIYNATVSSKLETSQIVVSGSYSKTSAQSTIDLINSGTLDYSLNVVQISSLKTSDATTSYTKMLIASLIVVVLLCIALITYYKLSGVMSALSLIINIAFSLLLFVIFKGVMNQQFIAALVVSVGLCIDSIIIVLERVKNELYNGKKMQKALQEGYKKAFVSIIDVNVVVLIMAIVMFMFGTSVASFALMIALSSVVNLVVMTIVNRLTLTMLVRLGVTPTMFGARKKYLENKEAYTARKLANIDPLKHKKKFAIGSSIFATLALIVMIVLQLTTGSLFNYNNTIKNNSSLTLVTTEEYFTNEEQVANFFREDLDLDVYNIVLSEVKEEEVVKYSVTLQSKTSIIKVEDELVNKIIANIGENLEYDENYELYINDITSQSTLTSLLSALYTVGIALVIIGVYIAIRYRYSYGIAAIVSTLSTLVFTALFLGLTRIKIGSDSIIAIFTISTYSIANLIVTFSRLKDNIASYNRKYLSNDERKDAMVKAIKSTLTRTLLTTITVTLTSVVLLIFATHYNYSFYISITIGLIICSICAVMIASEVWLLFELRSDTKKRTFKPKKKNSKFKELEESVIIGIND